MAPLFAPHPHHRTRLADTRLDPEDGIALIVGDGIAHQVFRGEVDQVTAVRRWAVAQLPGGRGHAAAYLVELLMCELATNAIRHTRSGRPGGAFEAAIAVGPWVWLGVYDLGGDSVPAPCPADITAQSGRGLAMLVQLSLAWGTKRAGLGRLVWCTVPTT